MCVSSAGHANDCRLTLCAIHPGANPACAGPPSRGKRHCTLHRPRFGRTESVGAREIFARTGRNIARMRCMAYFAIASVRLPSTHAMAALCSIRTLFVAKLHNLNEPLSVAGGVRSASSTRPSGLVLGSCVLAKEKKEIYFIHNAHESWRRVCRARQRHKSKPISDFKSLYELLADTTDSRGGRVSGSHANPSCCLMRLRV